MVIFLAGLAVTSCALYLTPAAAPHGVEIAVLTAANLLATVLRFMLRFVLLRSWVFARSRS